MQDKQSYVDASTWRAAVKKFVPTKKLEDSTIKRMLEALRMTPSSYGIQAMRVLVITDQAIKDKLTESLTFPQQQISSCSHLLVFMQKDPLDVAYVEDTLETMQKTKGLSKEYAEGYKNAVLGTLKTIPPEGVETWLEKQIYIALGWILLIAATEKIDACPMEGFSRPDFDAILNLKGSGFKSTVLCALGYRAEDEPAKKWPKFRREYNDLFKFL